MKLMRKRGANTVKRVIALAFCLLLILPFPAPAAAFAAETGELPDPDRTGSFTATFKYYDESTGKTLPVAGGNSVGLYKVADVVVDHGYQFVVDERFAAAGEIPATDEPISRRKWRRSLPASNSMRRRRKWTRKAQCVLTDSPSASIL